MKPTDDWARWAHDWQQQVGADIDDLQRRVWRKKWQMRVMTAVEILIGLFAVGQLVRLLLMPGVDERWKIWIGLAFVLVVVMGYLQLRVRRDTWHAATATIPDLLQLTAARARAGVKLAWLNIASFLVLLAITIPVAAPWLAPERWIHNPSLRHLLALQTGINGTVAMVLLVFFAFYIRRQKRRLAQVEAMLHEYHD